MRKFLCCRDNFAEKQAWQKYCWVNIEMPTEEDTLYLTRDLKIPSAFLSLISGMSTNVPVSKRKMAGP